MPVCVEICSQLEVFVSYEYTGSDQHSSACHSSVKRDVKDLEIFEKWLKDHQPLVPRNHNVMSLATGIIGDESINCHRSEEVGTDLVKINAGNNFHDVKFKHKMRVLPLSAVNPHSRVNDTVLPLSLIHI